VAWKQTEVLNNDLIASLLLVIDYLLDNVNGIDEISAICFGIIDQLQMAKYSDWIRSLNSFTH